MSDKTPNKETLAAMAEGDALTVAYMYGFEKGKDHHKAEIAQAEITLQKMKNMYRKERDYFLDEKAKRDAVIEVMREALDDISVMHFGNQPVARNMEALDYAKKIVADMHIKAKKALAEANKLTEIKEN